MSPSSRALLAAVLLTGVSAAGPIEVPAPTSVEGTPDATFTISGGVVAVGVGYEWARGTLLYRGRNIAFQVRGVSVMDLGAAKISGTGEVFNLKSLADFEGNYAGSTFGSAIPHGASLALVKNEHGVTLRARSTVSGLRLNFSGNGLHIKFVAPPEKNGVPVSQRYESFGYPFEVRS